MKKIMPLNIDAYEFDDLSEDAQEKVICDHINFWLECREYNAENKGNYEKAIDKSEDMQTPWFASGYVYDMCKDEVIQELKNNGYLYETDGNILPINFRIKDGKVDKVSLQISKKIAVAVSIV